MKQNVLLIPPIPIKGIVRASCSFSFPYLLEIDLGTSDAFCHYLVAVVRMRHAFPNSRWSSFKVRSNENLLFLLHHVRTQLYTF